MKKIIEKIEKLDITVTQWILGFSGIVFIRFILESISNPSTSGIIASDPQTLIHYFLFYLVAAAGSIYIIELFTAKGIKTANFILFFLSFMWLAPILDAFISRGKGFQLAYISDNGISLIRDLFTFFGPSFSHGATFGIRIELALIFFGISWFIWQTTKNLKKSVIGFVVSYIFVFVICALPGIVYTTSSAFSNTPLIQNGTGGYLADIISKSNIAFNSVHTTLVPYSYDRFIELGFDKLMSQFYFIILSIFLFLWFWKIKKAKLVAIFKNSRPERAGHYIILVLLGMWYAFVAGFGHFSSWVDVLGVICLAISWYAVWVFAVNVNDCEDVLTDKISNKSRPLIQNILTEKEMFQSGLIFLAVALLGAWSAGFYQFYMILVFISASYIYSVKPLRLKSVPIISTFLMSVASLSSILAGFFFISKVKVFYAFPPLAMLGILVCYTLLFNVKDLKDAEGDKAEGSYTIPVIFGSKNGNKIVAVLFGLSFLLIPFFFSTAFLYIISIPSSIIGYFLVAKYPHKEKYFFILYFLYILSGTILFL